MPNNKRYKNHDNLIQLLKELHDDEEAIPSLSIDDLDEIHSCLDAYLHYDALDNDEPIPCKEEIKEALIEISEQANQENLD